MESKISIEARIIYFYRSIYSTGPPPKQKWHNPEASTFGIPVSESYIRRVVPTIHGIDPELYALVTRILNVDKSLWYLLASDPLVLFFTELGLCYIGDCIR